MNLRGPRPVALEPEQERAFSSVLCFPPLLGSEYSPGKESGHQSHRSGLSYGSEAGWLQLPSPLLPYIPSSELRSSADPGGFDY